MDGFLRQSTASQSRAIGPFVDDTDFKTAETALTIANTDIKLRANGTTLSNKNSGGGTHQVNGMYSVTWDATDTANVGELKYSVVISGALQVFGSYWVLEEAIYDALFGASAAGFDANQRVDIAKAVGTAWNSGAITSSTFANNALPSVLVSTTIATLTSQTVFTLTAGSADDNAYAGAMAIFVDASTATQKAVGFVLSYVGASKQITLLTDPGIYTIAASDLVTLVADAAGAILANRLTAARALLLDNLGNLNAPVAGLSTLTAAQVNAEVVDALSVDTYVEPSAVPAATASIASKLGWIQLLARNKVIQNNVSQAVRNDADSLTVATSTFTDDGTTATRDEWV